MLVEALIFDRNHGVHERGRDLGEAHPVAIDAAGLHHAQRLTVPIEDCHDIGWWSEAGPLDIGRDPEPRQQESERSAADEQRPLDPCSRARDHCACTTCSWLTGERPVNSGWRRPSICAGGAVNWPTAEA